MLAFLSRLTTLPYFNLTCCLRQQVSKVTSIIFTENQNNYYMFYAKTLMIIIVLFLDTLDVNVKLI